MPLVHWTKYQMRFLNFFLSGWNGMWRRRQTWFSNNRFDRAVSFKQNKRGISRYSFAWWMKQLVQRVGILQHHLSVVWHLNEYDCSINKNNEECTWAISARMPHASRWKLTLCSIKNEPIRVTRPGYLSALIASRCSGPISRMWMHPRHRWINGSKSIWLLTRPLVLTTSW